MALVYSTKNIGKQTLKKQWFQSVKGTLFFTQNFMLKLSVMETWWETTEIFRYEGSRFSCLSILRKPQRAPLYPKEGNVWESQSMGSSVQGIWGRKAREKMLVKDFRTCHPTYAPVAESLSWVKRDLKSSRYRKSTLIFLFPSGDEIPIWKISCLHLKENNTLIYHRGSEKVRWREFYTNRPC